MTTAHIKSGDTVYVRAGRDAGKTGKVLEILAEQGRARVEGVMNVKRHLKKGRSANAPEGGILEKWGTVDISNLMVVCTACGKPSRTSRKTLDNGTKVRVCKKCDAQVE